EGPHDEDAAVAALLLATLSPHGPPSPQPLAGVRREELEARFGFAFGDVTASDRAPAARVERVVEGGPAAKAGLVAGELVDRADDTPITSAADLERVLARLKPGEGVRLSTRGPGGLYSSRTT